MRTRKVQALKNILKDFSQPPEKSSGGMASFRHTLSGNYDMWRIARFLFAEILSFKVWDQPFEKTNWSIPFRYKGKFRCRIVHEKFGFRVYVSGLEEKEAQGVALEIETVLQKALRASSTLIEEYAEEALKKGEIIVTNTFRQLREPYAFFRKKALAKEKLIERGTKGKMPHNWYKFHVEKSHYENAAYFSFFSLLEHLCVLFLGFRSIPERKDVGTFTRLKWSEKFKLIFDINDPDFKRSYDHFVGLARYQRNPAAHGNTNTVFDFYLTGARHKISVSISEHHVSLPWRDQKTNFETLEAFLKLIKSHASTKNIYLYISQGFNVAFLADGLSEHDLIVSMSHSNLKEYIDYMHRMSDDAANMDW